MPQDAARGMLRRGTFAGGAAMPITENTPQRLVLRSGSNTLTLDKVKDPVSGAIVSHTMLVARSGTAWVFAEAEKKDAEAAIAAVRGFLGLA